LGGKSVRGSSEDNNTPKQGGPPGAEPGGNHGFGRDAVTDLVEGGGGARIAPGFGGGHSLGNQFQFNCKRSGEGLQFGCEGEAKDEERKAKSEKRREKTDRGYI
jgi:hypothetical protein